MSYIDAVALTQDDSSSLCGIDEEANGTDFQETLNASINYEAQLSRTPTSPRSCWKTESTTPMTSRPHFPEYPPSPVRGVRRTRSRSLGSALDTGGRHSTQNRPIQQLTEYPVHFDDWRDYILSPCVEPPSTSTHLRNYEFDTFHNGTVKEDAKIQTETLMPLPDSKATAPSSSQATDVESGATASSTSTSVASRQAIEKLHEDHDNPAWICIMYGLINATIVLPVLMSFASIIYRDEAFAPAMPTLVKLTMVSGMVHQLCFSTFSSLPFAVGQVQDAGLIFLSSMATIMVDYCRTHNLDFETLMATATIGIPLATALLGVGLILLGRWQLAQYVQLLPTCVVGGYLAYIGWFCGMAGIGLMAGGASEITPQLVRDHWELILPGVFSGLVLYVSVRTLKHIAVLPCGIMLLLTMFYVAIWLRGVSLKSVTEQGWIRQVDDGAPLSWTHTWDFMKFNKVAWGVFPLLMLTELSMIFVVALSSSLDVAAIELEMQRPLDYNHELQTVGLSNLISGLTGGYTGSYIFSQSIFSFRAGIRSRLAGFVLAGCQLAIFLLPFPILTIVPNFFFGSLLTLICVDLMYEWLWQVQDKVSSVEYLVCLSTFTFCMWFGVEYGILLGVLIYLLCRQLGLNVGFKQFVEHRKADGELLESKPLLLEDTSNPGHAEDDIIDGDYGSLGAPVLWNSWPARSLTHLQT